jgi:uncharacterized membrane protein
LSTVVTTTHLGGMFLGGGLAIAADRATIRVCRPTITLQQLNELRAVHRPVLIGLTLVFLSGILLVTADLETFLKSPVFWVKMGVIVLLLVNGGVLARTERRVRTGTVSVERGSRWLRRAAIVSLALWFLALVLGAILPNA